MNRPSSRFERPAQTDRPQGGSGRRPRRTAPPAEHAAYVAPDEADTAGGNGHGHGDRAQPAAASLGSHPIAHTANDTQTPPSAPPSPPEPISPARGSDDTPPSPATPRAPCNRCGHDRIPDDAKHCPECQWPLDETYDGPDYAYCWQDGTDMRCYACGQLWSSKVRYCLGDWCGGPVEPLDGSWHVEWRLLNSANPAQLHTEMPVFYGPWS